MISKTGQHAIGALARLASLGEGQFAGATSLAQGIGAPPNYLGKLLNILAREGLVESRKGSGGGFRLARPAESIALLDIVDPIDNVGKWNACYLGHPTCSDQTACTVHDRWSSLREGYLALLAETTLADIGRHEHEARAAKN